MGHTSVTDLGMRPHSMYMYPLPFSTVSIQSAVLWCLEYSTHYWRATPGHVVTDSFRV